MSTMSTVLGVLNEFCEYSMSAKGYMDKNCYSNIVYPEYLVNIALHLN